MAKEYIEREAAKQELLTWVRCINHPERLMTEDAIHVLDTLYAADVAPVVHCKNCRYWDRYNHSGRCEAPVNGLVRENTSANDFCSYGERKGDVEI